MSVTMPGQRLREARERTGLEIEEAARRLHLSTTFVRALERDDYDRLPEPTFIKGYIRNYARLLGLPADELVGLFQQATADVEVEQEEPVRPLRAPLESRRRQSWMVGAAAVAVVALLIWAGTGPDEAPETAPATATAPAAPVEEQEIEAAQEPPAAEPEVDEPVLRADEATEPVAAPDRLTMTFNDDCWVRVENAAGEEVHVGVEGAGSMLTLDGRAPFRITLGNAAAVDSILVNGRAASVPRAEPGRVRTVRVP